MSESNLPSFFARLWMAFVCFWAILLRPRFAQAILPTYQAREALPANFPSPTARRDTRDVDMERDNTVSAPAVMKREPGPVVHKSRAEPKPDVRPVAGMPMAPERQHASALFVLGVLQREGRFIDFLQEDVSPFSDAEVGAAARVVHEGCRKVLQQYVAVKPVLPDAEGARVSVPVGFDAGRIRLTGNVTGQPPFMGALKHHGWVTQEIRLPDLNPTLDPRVLAPAEVELS